MHYRLFKYYNVLLKKKDQKNRLKKLYKFKYFI